MYNAAGGDCHPLCIICHMCLWARHWRPLEEGSAQGKQLAEWCRKGCAFFPLRTLWEWVLAHLDYCDTGCFERHEKPLKYSASADFQFPTVTASTAEQRKRGASCVTHWSPARTVPKPGCIPPIKATHGVSENPCADFHGNDLLPSRSASARLVMGTPCTGRIFSAGREVDGSAARWGSHVGSIAPWKHRGRRATLAIFVDEQTKTDEMVEK